MKKKPTKKISKPKRGRPKTSDSGNILSDRETEVMSHLKDGKQYDRIGEILFISTETVRKHASNIYKKLKVENRIQAINKFFGQK